MIPEGPKIGRLQAWAIRLNRRQTRALAMGAMMCILFAMYPSWYFLSTNEVGGKTRRAAGFNFIGAPPVYGGDYFRAEARIDWLMSGLVEAVCIGITAGFVAGMRDKNNEANSTYGQYR